MQRVVRSLLVVGALLLPVQVLTAEQQASTAQQQASTAEQQASTAQQQASTAQQQASTAQQQASTAQQQGGQGRQGGQGAQGGEGGNQGVLGGVGTPGRRGGPPPKPAPRNAAGRVLLGGATPSEKGVWLPVFGILDPILATAKTPYQPWSREVYEFRQKNELEPHTRCKPSGGARQFLTPYGVEFVELPEIERMYIFDIGGPHTYRTIYMDGRTHPAHMTPTYYGHSVGWWDGDTLNVDTVGYNEAFWIDRRGMPTTDTLHTLERFTRTDSATIRYEITVDDPGAYTAPWTTEFNLRWEGGTELFEYVCQQSNYAGNLMVGDQKSVDRTTTIVP